METSACDGDVTKVDELSGIVRGVGVVSRWADGCDIGDVRAGRIRARGFRTTSGKVAEAPAASGPVQVTVSGTPTGGIVQLKPAGVARETKVEPVGITSV